MSQYIVTFVQAVTLVPYLIPSLHSITSGRL